MDVGETPRPDPNEVTTPVKREIEQIGEKVLKSIQESPPTKRPANGQSDSFWSTPAILTGPDVVYGDVRVCAPCSDVHGSTCCYSREILDREGKAIGTWKKSGYYLPNQPDEAAWFEEEINLRDSNTMERITVNLNFATRRVWSIGRQIAEKPNYYWIKDEALRYYYDNEGKILRIELVNNDPTTGARLSCRDVFLREAINTSSSQVVATPEIQPPQSSSIPAEITEQPAPTGGKKPNIFRRLFGR